MPSSSVSTPIIPSFLFDLMSKEREREGGARPLWLFLGIEVRRKNEINGRRRGWIGKGESDEVGVRYGCEWLFSRSGH